MIEQYINPRVNVFVCPLLPTRLFSGIDKINDFNSLIFNDLQFNNYNISIIEGFIDFVGEAHLLDPKYSRGEGDYLHLNGYGIKILANKIKTHIFNRKRGHSRTVAPELAYAKVVQRSPHSPSHLS